MKMTFFSAIILISCFREPQAIESGSIYYAKQLQIVSVSNNHDGNSRHSKITNIRQEHLTTRYMLGGNIDSYPHFFSIYSDDLKHLNSGEEVMIEVEPSNNHTHILTIRYINQELTY